jgi:MauM/NapG family ferredoxin protein
MTCELQSRMGAYDNAAKEAEEAFSHQIAECIHCYRCTTICPEGVIEAKLGRPGSKGGHLGQDPVNLSRRHALGSVGLGLGWLATTKAASSPDYRSDRCIRPPGALPEEQFLQACIRCGECMRACPTNGLQPALSEAGLEGWMSPVLVPKIGPCVEQCTLCGEVCPTDAIRSFTMEQKRHEIRLGLAVVDQDTCIAYNGGRDCIVCAEVCSYSAVIFKDIQDDLLGRTKRVPTVDETLCTGCGICETKCPVTPQRAIFVRVLRENRTYRAPRPSIWGGFVRR